MYIMLKYLENQIQSYKKIPKAPETVFFFEPRKLIRHSDTVFEFLFNPKPKEKGCSLNCGGTRTSDKNLPWETHEEYGGWGGADFFETNEGAENPPSNIYSR